MVPAMRVQSDTNLGAIHMDEYGNNMQVSVCDLSMSYYLFDKKAKLNILQAPRVCSTARKKHVCGAKK